jgi:uncharacterized protein
MMLTKTVIEQVINSQKERLNTLNTGLPRQIKTSNNITTHAFIVSGIRRSGKSTWLQQIYHKTKENSIYLNFEDPRLAGFDIDDFNRLHEIAQKTNATVYFFDEIQNILKWENFVRFRLDEAYKIFITGSNASMLSKELGTKLTGRHITREMFPFSYNEFLAFTETEANQDSSIKYLQTGGFPEYLKTEIPDVLMNIFNDIIIRDIAVRYNINNTNLLLQLAVWLISNTGKFFTGNSLRKIFNIGSSSSIMDYLSYFSDAYLFFFIPKFSYSHKVQLVNPKKIYCIDNGLITINSVSFTDDKGRLLENMVFMHLRRKFKEIYYYSDKGECDFVVFENGKLFGLYQVYFILNDTNLQREINGLKEAMNFFNVKSATIITQNQNDSFDIENLTIRVLPFYEWAKQVQ